MTLFEDYADIVRKDVELAPLTSFRIGGPARLLCEPASVVQLAGLLAALDEAGVAHRLLGGGSNVLVADEGFEGAVIRLTGEFARVRFDPGGAYAGAALTLGRLVGECARRGMSGVEALAGIPGTVGGALVMNAGGRVGTISDVVESVHFLGDGGAVHELSRGEIGFGYRTSSLKGLTLLGCRLRLTEDEPARVAARSAEALDLKRHAQDLKSPSAGCIFVNPDDAPSAGELIDKAGLKGHSIGGAAVSQRHANYIINTGEATAGDVKALISLVRKRVFETSGIDLSLEIELW